MRDTEDIIEAAFADIANEAYHVNYDLQVDSQYNITLTPIAKNCAGVPMPDITVETIVDGNSYYYNPTVKFPTLTHEENCFSDNIEYFLDRWAKIGKFITHLIKFEFNESEWLDEEEE